MGLSLWEDQKWMFYLKWWNMALGLWIWFNFKRLLYSAGRQVVKIPKNAEAPSSLQVLEISRCWKPPCILGGWNNTVIHSSWDKKHQNAMDQVPFHLEVLVFGHFWCKWQGDALYQPDKEGIELAQQFGVESPSRCPAISTDFFTIPHQGFFPMTVGLSHSYKPQNRGIKSAGQRWAVIRNEKSCFQNQHPNKSTQISLAQVGGFLQFCQVNKWVLLRSKKLRWNLTIGNCRFFKPSFPGSISIFEGVIPNPTWCYMIEIPIRRQSTLIITT